MNYVKIYDSIILQSKNRGNLEGYFERHHVSPRSLGGSDENENIVELTAREHFICHRLLVKIHDHGPSHHKMVKALNMMLNSENRYQNRYKTTARVYEILRKQMSLVMSVSQSKSGNSQFGKMWINNGITSKKIEKGEIPEGWIKGRVMSAEAKAKIQQNNLSRKGIPLLEETRRKMSISQTGKVRSEETKIKIGLGAMKPRTEETKKKISQSLTGHIRSDEAKKSMSEAAKRRWAIK